MIVDDRDILVHRVLFFPRARLHRLEWRTNDHLHILAAEPTRRSAAVHCGIPAAEDDHSFADLFRVLESDACQPVNADMNVIVALLPSRDLQFTAVRCSGSDKDRVVSGIKNVF